MTPEEHRAMLAESMSEEALQASTVRLATDLSWWSYHTHNSRRSNAGWPDLVLLRRGRIVISELKKQNGRTSKPQDECLELLELVESRARHLREPAGWPDRGPLFTVCIWRPSDLLDGTILRVLT